jgi:hypothetical protein
MTNRYTHLQYLIFQFLQHGYPFLTSLCKKAKLSFISTSCLDQVQILWWTEIEKRLFLSCCLFLFLNILIEALVVLPLNNMLLQFLFLQCYSCDIPSAVLLGCFGTPSSSSSSSSLVMGTGGIQWYHWTKKEIKRSQSSTLEKHNWIELLALACSLVTPHLKSIHKVHLIW